MDVVDEQWCHSAVFCSQKAFASSGVVTVAGLREPLLAGKLFPKTR